MKTALAFAIGLLIFTAGMQGRLGSMLAAIIDPGALQDISASGPNAVNPGVPILGIPPSKTPKPTTPCNKANIGQVSNGWICDGTKWSILQTVAN